jgi:arylsulfatase A-like enzyme
MIIRRSLFTALLVLLLLTGCLPGLSGPTPAATVSPLPSLTFPPLPTGTPTASLTPAPSLAPSQTARPQPAVSRVLILSLDGMRPDAIQQAPMLNLLGLMQAGAYSLVAQTIYPSATLPSHTSMLTGLCPSQHGVLWNDYDPSQGYAIGTDLFDLAHAAGLTTVMVVGKDKLRQITEPASTDQFKYINDRGLVIARYVAEQVIPNGFGLLFIHFPTPDWMGHEYGWMSWQYLDVLRQDDQGLGLLLEALDQAGLRSDTLVIVTADHGGHDTTHGSSQPEDMTVPWVVSGPGVVPGGVAVPISTTDTAATAAWVLGLSLPAEWAGIPVYEAFGQTSPVRPEPRCP